MWANNKKVAWTITATASTATKNSPCNWIFLKRESTAQVSYSHRCITAINKRQMHSLRDTILDRHTVHTFTICDREQQQRHVNNTRRAWRIYKLNDWREKISSEKKKRRRLNNTQQLRNKPKAIFDELDATLMFQFFCNFVVFFSSAVRCVQRLQFNFHHVIFLIARFFSLPKITLLLFLTVWIEWVVADKLKS